MAVTEVYVDASIGADSGAGTIGDPYGRLSYAFTQSSSVTNGKRYNVKGTTLGSPETSFGTPPNGSTTSPVYIQGYTAAAGDGGTLFVDGGGSAIVTDTNKDGIHCIDCHFKNYGSSWAFSLDNNCSFIRCTFDGGGTGYGVDGDNHMVAYNCYFTNIKNKVYFSSGNGGKFCFNTVHVTTIDADEYAIQQAQAIIGNRIRIDASVDIALYTNQYRSGIVAYNSIKGTRGGRRDYGIYVGSQQVVRCNYLEGFEEAIVLAAPAVLSGNVFFNNDDDVLEAATGCNLCDPVVGENSTVLGATGLPDVDDLDFTPSAALRDVTVANNWNRDAAALTTGIEQKFGAVLNVVESTSGVTFKKRMRIF